jgi:hypothetical protein
MTMAPTQASRKHRLPASPSCASAAGASRPALPITLQVKGGLLMAFGPDGDPVPASLAKRVCSEAEVQRLRLRNGIAVDCQRALAVLEAQQRGKLSMKPSNRWIEAMLGLAGGFEPTPDALLGQEPDDALPAIPDPCRG